MLTRLSPLIRSYTMSFSQQTLQRQLAELPAILDRFYTTITNDQIGVEVGVVGSHESGGFSMC